MRPYEIIFIVRPDINEDTIEKNILSKVKQIVERHHGEFLKIEKWGLRKLAYSIKKFEDGYYILTQIKGDPILIGELERNSQIDENILRFMIIRLKEKDIKKNIAELGIPKEEEI